MSRHNFKKPPAASKAAQGADWLKPVGTCLGLLLSLAGLRLAYLGLVNIPVGQNPVDFNTHGLDYSWNLYFSGVSSHADFITGVILLGGAAGFFWLAWGWLDPTPPKAAINSGVFYGIGAALAVCIALFILHYGMHQIGGNDQSLLVEIGWRLFNGQTAFVDFPCTPPVAFVLGAKFAFQWFGVYWRSFIDIDALFAMLTFAWSVFLLAQLFGRSWTTLLWAMAFHAISLMLASYWWYNPITAATAVLYILSAMYWLRRPAEKIAFASYGAALLLLATMKPNAAGILTLGISVILFMSPRHRWKMIGVSLGAFAFYQVLLAINHLSFTSMFAGLMGVANRSASIAQFLGAQTAYSPAAKNAALTAATSIMLPVVLALGQGRKTLRSPLPWIPAVVLLGGLCVFVTNNPQVQIVVGPASIVLSLVMALYLGRKTLCSLGPWIPMIALLSGLHGFFTNGEEKLADLPPVLCAAILLVAELRCPVFPKEGPVFPMPVRWNRYLSLLCVVLGAAGLAQAIARDRIRVIGPIQFFEWNDSHTLTNGFFKGLHCGDVFDEMLKEEAEVLSRSPSSTVEFGSGLQWGYAAFAKPSPLHQPMIWDGGRTMYAKSKEEFYFNNMLQSRPQLFILFKNNIGGFNQDEVQRILQQYDVDQSFPLLTILHLKQ